MVNSVAISPPRLKVFVAVLTHCCPITSIDGSPPTPAAVSFVHSTCANPFATTEMKALQLHHVINAVTAMQNPLMVNARYFGEKSSDIFARWAAVVFFHRSGSLINIRRSKAAAAGIRPKRNTYRQDTLGSVK